MTGRRVAKWEPTEGQSDPVEMAFIGTSSPMAAKLELRSHTRAWKIVIYSIARLDRCPRLNHPLSALPAQVTDGSCGLVRIPARSSYANPLISKKRSCQHPRFITTKSSRSLDSLRVRKQGIKLTLVRKKTMCGVSRCARLGLVWVVW
jgi:hypothetical protein